MQENTALNSNYSSTQMIQANPKVQYNAKSHVKKRPCNSELLQKVCNLHATLAGWRKSALEIQQSQFSINRLKMHKAPPL